MSSRPRVWEGASPGVHYVFRAVINANSHAVETCRLRGREHTAISHMCNPFLGWCRVASIALVFQGIAQVS